MPFSRADGRALLFLGSLALLASGILLMSGAMPPRSVPPAQEEGPAAPVWVNLASVDELASLPGIGPVIAERIVRYRLLHGPFRSLDELGKVPGIGPQILKAVQDRVRLDCPSSTC